jgi:hypothetical protein
MSANTRQAVYKTPQVISKYPNCFGKRLGCINFPTEFVDNPINENQKKINVKIDKNFDFWKLDFMLLLIEKYKKYICDSIINVSSSNFVTIQYHLSSIFWDSIYAPVVNASIFFSLVFNFAVKKLK